MRFKEFLNEAKLKGYINPSTIFSGLEINVFFTLLVDQPDVVWESEGFKDETIPLNKLVPLQSEVDGKVDNDNPLTVVRRKGINYIVDGHHRLYTALKKKATTVVCSVLELPDEQINSLQWFIDKLGVPLKMSNNGIVRRGY